MIAVTTVYNGRALPVYGFKGGGNTVPKAGAVLAGDLTPDKARILTLIALPRIEERAAFQALFDTWEGTEWRRTRRGWDRPDGSGGPVRLYLSDVNGAPSPAQAVVAAQVRDSLDAFRDAATSYLDHFVDRARACGRTDMPWWLDEIEFRDNAASDPVCYALHFALGGDDGGLWTVDMRAGADGHRPIRFERRQG